MNIETHPAPQQPDNMHMPPPLVASRELENLNHALSTNTSQQNVSSDRVEVRIIDLIVGARQAETIQSILAGDRARRAAARKPG